ncbi:LIC12015 family putative lipoprotein [Leptospira idonii]|uniref:Peptidylprolyl isomerase n=1 Tax=Leptospira idonii TaxID=1193500 RepID=A0A4R9LYX9_9LEPT|nr:hypothetical protein [Leptospira idonii]TGN18577.1 hypothetical protein EHS15_14430 [Leptospira idonii]
MTLKKLSMAMLIFGICSLSFVNCSKDSEILATFDGGTVTRGEMNFLAETFKRGSNKPLVLDSEKQLKLIEQVALEKLVFLDGVKLKKFDPSEADQLETLLSDFIKLNVYIREYVKYAVQNKPLEFIDLQIALVRGPNGEENQKNADELVAKLNAASESEKNALIAEVTADSSRKPVYGKLEPFCTNCSINPLEDIISEAKKAPKGTFVKYSKGAEDPIVYVLRSLGTERVHPERLEKYFASTFEKFSKEAIQYGETHTDEESKNAVAYFTEGNEERAAQFAQHTMKQFEQGLYVSEMNKIKEESGFTIGELPPAQKKFLDEAARNQVANYLQSPDRDRSLSNAALLEKFYVKFPPNSPDMVDVNAYTNDVVLFSTKDGKTYTWGNLREDFDKLPNRLKSNYKDEAARIWDILNLYQGTILQGKIAQTSDRVQKAEKESSYKIQIDKMRMSIGLKVLQDEIEALPVEVTETQIRDAYEAGKLYAYSSPDPKNPQNRIPLPYGQVREEIKKDMANSQKNSFIQQKISGLKSSYNLKIAEDRLKEVSI